MLKKDMAIFNLFSKRHKKGKIPEVFTYNRLPPNLKVQIVHIISDVIGEEIGGNKYINVPNILIYKGESVFRITRAESTGLLGIDFDIFDSNGNKIAVVKNGRIYQGDKERYNVEVQADRYILTDKQSKQVLCDIRKKRGRVRC